MATAVGGTAIGERRILVDTCRFSGRSARRERDLDAERLGRGGFADGECRVVGHWRHSRAGVGGRLSAH
jgi:hypothetical protein